MQCDLCGKQDATFTVEIEGTRMQVCKSCSTFGKIITIISKETPRKKVVSTYKSEQKKDLVKLVMRDYSTIIKNARERKGFKQEDFAKSINEKVSLIHNIESGRQEPSIPLAEQLEKILGIKLVEFYEEDETVKKSVHTKDLNVTVESLVNIKYRKK